MYELPERFCRECEQPLGPLSAHWQHPWLTRLIDPNSCLRCSLWCWALLVGTFLAQIGLLILAFVATEPSKRPPLTLDYLLEEEVGEVLLGMGGISALLTVGFMRLRRFMWLHRFDQVPAAQQDCIFCQRRLPARAIKCPHCGNFTDMM